MRAVCQALSTPFGYLVSNEYATGCGEPSLAGVMEPDTVARD